MITLGRSWRGEKAEVGGMGCTTFLLFDVCCGGKTPSRPSSFFLSHKHTRTHGPHCYDGKLAVVNSRD